MAKKQRQTHPSVKPTANKTEEKKKMHKPLLLPTTVVFFLAVWAWAWLWYGDVFRVAREFSFWAPDETLMYHMEGRPWGGLLVIGQMLLQLYRWPILGGAVMALMITASTWLVGYNLRLPSWLRPLQYVPAAVFMTVISYLGFNIFFETETGTIMGIPFVCTVALLVIGVMIRSFSRKPVPSIVMPPKDETPLVNRLQLLVIALAVVIPMALSYWMKPEVRIVTTMQRQMMEQDWHGMQETARTKPELSYRPIAAFYAIALVQTSQQCERMFDIRMDYDDPGMIGFGGNTNNYINYYQMECDYYAGLVETCIHHAMEQMTMNGPNLRALKLLTKCALLRGEWEVAEKYLTVLSKVPFEGDWVEKYSAMLHNEEMINSDKEMAMVRLTEPIHDTFENTYMQPAFLGYNLSLMEGRSNNALWNSLMVNIYTKTMPQFIMRCQPMQGTTPPQTIAEALTLMSNKYPDINGSFAGLDFHRQRLANFLQEVSPYVRDNGALTSAENRALHAKELFPKYKGYYPYYYFFGNLKATKKSENTGTSNSGVN